VNLQEEGRRLKWGVIWDDGTCLSLLQKKKRSFDEFDFSQKPLHQRLPVAVRYQLLSVLSRSKVMR